MLIDKQHNFFCGLGKCSYRSGVPTRIAEAILVKFNDTLNF